MKNFGKIAVILLIVCNVGCHGFSFTSPMFDFHALGQQDAGKERGSPEDTGAGEEPR
jgi:hypothetical protein